MPDQHDLETLYQQMPRRYRFFTKILLKIPNPSIPFFVVRRFQFIEGLLYGFLFPIFAFVSGAFMLILFPTAMMTFAFPLNYIVLFILPAAVFIVYVRIEFERTINWWRSEFGSPKEWDSSKSLDELIELFRKQQNKTEKRKVA